MQNRFENKCVCTLDNLREMTTHTRKTGYVVYISVCYVLLFLLGVTIPLYNGKIIMAVAVLGILFVTGIYFFMMPRINAKKQYEFYKKMCSGNELQIRVIIYDDRIENIDVYNNKYTEIEYTDIKKIVETDNLFNIILNNDSVIMLDKNGFIKGEAKEFYAFIVEKINQ